MAIGNNLKRLREVKGYSQEIVAEKIGVSRQAVSKWENGTSKPSTENLIQLSELFEVKLETLTNDKAIDEKKANNKPVKYFKSYEDKMRVLSFLSRVGIIVALTGYYGYYLPKEDASLTHWILLFLASCGLLFYANKEYYNVKDANKRLRLWDLALVFVVVFIPRILRLNLGWNILIMNGLAAMVMHFTMDLMRKRWKI